MESGGRLSRALANNMNIPRSVACLLDHGESSGQLADAVSTCRDMLEKGDELIKKILSSVTYPLAIGLCAGVLVVALVRGVMPQITPLLKSLNGDLPLLTRITIAISDGLVSYGLYMLIFIVICIIVAVVCYKRSAQTREIVHFILLKIPLLGELTRLYNFSVFLGSMGYLIRSGMPLMRAYSDAVESISLIMLRRSLSKSSLSLSSGSSLHEILSINGFPEYVVALISAGESSGTLGESLVRSSSIIAKNLDYSFKKITSLLEPAMMAGMGATVGSIALSIMMPIYEISKTIQRS
jgi:type II secretory pathway component PulF